MNPQSLRLRLLTVSLFSGLAGSSLHSATVNWDGGFVGGANNSGNWTDATNWSTDVVPLAPANTSDDVKFLDVTVTSGTRTVSINNGENVTAKTINFTQTTAGAANILSIASGGTLSLNSAQTWSAASAGTARIDLGGTINFSVYNSGTVTVNTDLTFTGAGANFTHGGGSASPVLVFGGAVNVNAGAGVAQISDSTAHSITATFGSTSSLLINTGTLEFTTTLYNSTPGVAVTVQGSTTIASGAGIKLTTDSASNAGGGNSGVTFTNTGTLGQAGTITTNGRGSGGTSTLTNSGTWKVNGLAAVIEKANRSGAANPTFVNSSGAVFSGATTADKIDFNHLQTAGTDIAFTNSGIIAAGNGSSGSGLTSVGTLTLVDFNISNSASTSSLTFDIGGTTSGQFDVLALQSSSMTLTNATLAINLVNGFAPSSSFSVDILTSDAPSSVTGSFVGLTVNGSANSDYSFAYNSTTGIGTLSYAASSIPEPSTYAIAAGVISLGMVSLRRRRGKNVSV